MAHPSKYHGASATAISHHYDVGNEFYELWLDKTMSYSCAMWGHDGDTLQAAQERKCDYLASEAKVTTSAVVLDIGCGWGGMLRRLVEYHGVSRAVGLTLSTAQAEYQSQRNTPGCYDVRVENWTDHQPKAPYDAILSVGAFEHFARFGMSREARVEAYRRFFKSCYSWLPRGARLALQTNVKGSNTNMSRETVREMLFIVKHIFPQSVIPWPSEILDASERLFDVVSIRNDPDDYARTCREWRSRLLANQQRAANLAGTSRVRDYERYLDAAVSAFADRHLGLMRIIFQRV
jgi:cyclopropane-fatty-acyl-phospholipid synthase